MFAVVHVAVDVYAAPGRILETMLGARMVEYAEDAAGPLHAVLDRLPGDWRQLTLAEVTEYVALRVAPAGDPWEQMTLF